MPKKTGSKEEQEWRETFLEVFWPAYPRKSAKKYAMKCWMRINGKGQQKLDLIWAGLERAKASASWQRHDYIPHASTWLNGERWEDEEP